MDVDTCVRDDCLRHMHTLRDGSVDMVLTDPPWGTTRLEFDATGRPDVEVWEEVRRVLKDDGWCMTFGTAPMFADVLAAGLTDAWNYVWIKSQPNINYHPEYRPATQHELINVSHKDGVPSKRYFDLDALITYGHPNYYRKGRPRINSTWDQRYGIERSYDTRVTDGSRMPTTLLYFHAKNKMRHRDRSPHPTQKPHALLAYLIRGYCPPDGVVYDPYAGSGATLIAARDTGRKWLGVEIDERWHSYIEQRMKSVVDPSWGTDDGNGGSGGRGLGPVAADVLPAAGAALQDVLPGMELEPGFARPAVPEATRVSGGGRTRIADAGGAAHVAARHGRDTSGALYQQSTLD